MKWICTTFILMMASAWAYGQEPAAPEEVPWPQFYYQIFLDDTLQSIEQVIYEKDSTDIEFKLSPDGQAIYLLDYDGKSSVRATYTDIHGTSHTVGKPHCHIHGLEHL